MKFLSIAFLIMLVGCASTPTVMDWPNIPAELKQPAPTLTPLDPKQRSLSELIQNANDNYSKYYELKNRYEAWQQWNDRQQKIYNGVITKTQNN